MVQMKRRIIQLAFIILALFIVQFRVLNVQCQTPGGTTPIRWVSELPAKCETNKRPRVLVYKYTATSGVYYCSATNTWTLATNAGTITGSGGANLLPKWTSSSTLGNSRISDNGSNILTINGGTGFVYLGDVNTAGNATTIGISDAVEVIQLNSDPTLGAIQITGGSILFQTLSFWMNRTITPSGTTGNQTINKPVGTVNFAAAASAITVTNSTVTTNSIIFTTIRTADATCTAVKSTVPGTGSFTITLNAGCTAQTSVGFMVTN